MLFSLLDIVCNMRVDWRDRRLIWNLYMGQSAYVWVNDGFSDACEIGRGVRQGCALTPLLYTIHDEAMMKEAKENVQERISLAGATVSLIRYADDKAVVASSQRGLHI